jgi:hypothetical protein
MKKLTLIQYFQKSSIALVQTAAFPLDQNIWPVRLTSTILRDVTLAWVSIKWHF